MAQIPWDETTPLGSSYVSELADNWRSFKSSVDAALREHFYWSDSTSSAGQPKLSTSTPGSFRAYHGSAVSNPGRIGTLMVSSDRSRLTAFPSSSSAVVGSQRMVTVLRTGAITDVANARWLAQSGTTDVAEGVNNSFHYPTPYGAPPLIWITASATATASVGSHIIALLPGAGDTKSGFSLACQYIGGGANPNDARAYWYSEGTVAL